MNSVAVYAELPEYKAVKAAKDAISADAEASKILQNMLPSKRKFKTSTDRSMLDASFQAKMENFGKQIQGIASCQNSLPSNNWQFTFS